MVKTLVGYDFTLSCEKQDDLNKVIQFLNGYCKKWVFQKEVSEGGYVHWQGRVHLMKAKAESTVRNEMKLYEDVKGIHWSITSKDVHLGNNFNYVLKFDTKIEGPWCDKEYIDPPKLTRQLKAFMKFPKRVWQQQVEYFCNEEDDRNITLIIDRIGNSGKSIFCEYLEYKQIALELPPMRNMEDLMAVVKCCPVMKAYVIDMPRAMKKDKLSEFYSGIECIKNGYAYDKRYKFEKMRFDRPQVIVFTNKEPKWDYMSADRWRVFDMANDYTMDERDISTYLLGQESDDEEL